jgi:excisionase family DNA binding protein
MKSASSTSSDSRVRTNAKSRRPVLSSNDFASPSETRALLAGSLRARQKRLDAGDMISTEEAAELTGTTRVTVNAWIAKGRAIGLTQAKRGYRLPRWQFDRPMWDALPRLSSALGTAEGWALLAFLEAPLGGLDAATPREAIERGDGERVVELASRGS